jgi:protein-disulfide isomerase
MRAFKTLIVALSVMALAACSQHKNATLTDEDMSTGKADAPVTVVEYASVACPGCAKFNNESWAELKKNYVDTGKARWVIKEMFTHDPAWAAMGFMTARCLGKDKYFDAVDAMFHAQPDIDASHDIKGGLQKVASQFGMSGADFEKCVGDTDALTKMNDRVEKTSREDKIDSTPTFIINGKVFADEPTAAKMGAAIDAAAAAKKG